MCYNQQKIVCIKVSTRQQIFRKNLIIQMDESNPNSVSTMELSEDEDAENVWNDMLSMSIDPSDYREKCKSCG